MKCTYFNAFTGVPVYSRARKIEIKWAKTASPPIHVASQYESINVSPPFGLSVNRPSPASPVYPRSPPRRPREWPVSKRSIFEKGLSKCSVTLACRYIIEKREHSRRASISSRSVRRGWQSEVTIRCFSLESNILNGNSKWMIILQRGMDRAFLKVWWSREYFLDFIETRKYSRLYVCI